MGICTHIPISLSPSRRQWGSRYAIRAGRNLPDKEFRYLRTVIVTAAVYWGFDSELCLRGPLLLTFQHRAGVRPYTSPCGFAESCVFAKQSLPPGHCDPSELTFLQGDSKGHTFFRSYGVNLPSSFWMVLSHALGCSPHLLVSDFGTGARLRDLELFLGAWNQSIDFDPEGSTLPHHLWELCRAVCVLRLLARPPTGLNWHRLPAGLSSSVPPGLYIHGGTGILTCFPSATPVGLALGSD